jgi:hypothetical protein
MKNLHFCLLLAGLLFSPMVSVSAAPSASPAPTADALTETLTVGQTKNHVETHAISQVDSLDPSVVGIVLSGGKSREFQTYGIRNGGPVPVTVIFTDKTTKTYSISVTGGTK